MGTCAAVVIRTASMPRFRMKIAMLCALVIRRKNVEDSGGAQYLQLVCGCERRLQKPKVKPSSASKIAFLFFSIINDQTRIQKSSQLNMLS